MNDVIKKVNSYKYKLAVFSDSTDFIAELSENDLTKLLELRAFDESGEIKLYRSSLANDFKIREISDENNLLSFDRAYYLDIDTKRSDNEGRLKFTTGGGSYHLPENKKLIKVRYYYEFDDEAVAKKTDWRLAGFTNEEDKYE